MERPNTREHILNNALNSWKHRILEGFSPLEARIDTFNNYELTEEEKSELFEAFCYQMEYFLESEVLDNEKESKIFIG